MCISNNIYHLYFVYMCDIILKLFYTFTICLQKPIFVCKVKNVKIVNII